MHVFSKYFKSSDERMKMMRELAGLRAQVMLTTFASCWETKTTFCGPESATAIDLAHFIAGVGVPDIVVARVAHDLTVELPFKREDEDDEAPNLLSLLNHNTGNIAEFLVCYSQALRNPDFLHNCRAIFYESPGQVLDSAFSKLKLFNGNE
jgi:hypothetical protein